MTQIKSFFRRTNLSEPYFYDIQEKLKAAWDESIFFQGTFHSPPPYPPQIESPKPPPCRPLFSILSRKKSRTIRNERRLLALARSLGFRVQVLKPDSGVPLAWLWGKLRGKVGGNVLRKWGKEKEEGPSAGGITLGVHGAALTHFLFLREGDFFLQVRIFSPLLS